MTGTESARGGPRRLLLSIHDVSPRHEAAVDRLRDHLAAAGGSRFAMLVVPDFWRESPILPGSAFAGRLRRWAEEGAEMFLHGYSHRDESRHESWVARIKARRMTAGEGEFLGLDADEAQARIRDGKALVEDIIGHPIAGFVAPAWLYGEGAMRAMAALRIPLAEDHWKVWSPASGETLARSPVITWATRTPARKWSSLAVARVARTLPLPRVVRVGVHPGDVREPATMASIRRTVAHLRRTHRPSGYADLARDPA